MMMFQHKDERAKQAVICVQNKVALGDRKVKQSVKVMLQVLDHMRDFIHRPLLPLYSVCYLYCVDDRGSNLQTFGFSYS